MKFWKEIKDNYSFKVDFTHHNYLLFLFVVIIISDTITIVIILLLLSLIFYIPIFVNS